MLTFEFPSQLKQLNLKHTICTVGVFDGVHIGHQKLIRRIVQAAKECGGKSVVVTFDKHPYSIINPSAHIPLLTLPAHKLQLLEELKVDVCVMMKFDKASASMPAEVWIKEVLWNDMHIEAIYLGEDAVFGKNGEGNINLLSEWGKKLGFRAIKMDFLRLEKTPVSSTAIRNFITDGNLKSAEEFLGRPYSVLGKHVAGKNRGRRLGFPTINLDTQEQCLPPDGVYAVLVNNNIPAAANLGTNPTFEPAEKKSILEVHILSDKIPANIENIEIIFIEKIRNEIKFPGIPELVAQIKQDIIRVKNIFSQKL